jgi:hypothetical protein
VGKPDRKRPIGRPGQWWVNDIKIDLEEIGWRNAGWIGLAQDRIGTNRWLL